MRVKGFYLSFTSVNSRTTSLYVGAPSGRPHADGGTPSLHPQSFRIKYRNREQKNLKKRNAARCVPRLFLGVYFILISLELFISMINAPMLCRKAPASALITPNAERAIITKETENARAIF